MHGKVSLIPLGGMSEVGARNCYAIEHNGHVLLLDCGQKIPPSNLVANSDGILPDEYYPDVVSILEKGWQIDGILVSHTHVDHAGGLPWLEEKLALAYPDREMPPICVSRFGQNVIQNIIYRRNRLANDFRLHALSAPSTQRLLTWHRYRIGPFTIQMFPVIHSTPGSSGFSVEVGGKHILYFGDCKNRGDYMEQREFEDVMAEMRRKRVDVLLLDSTNAQEDGYALPERAALKCIEDVMRERRHARLAIASFSSNVKRQSNLIRIAHEQRRHVYALGASLSRYLQAGHVNPGWWRPYRIGDGWRGYGEKYYPELPDDAIVLVTGVEGEEGSGMFKLLTDVPSWNGRKDAIMIAGSTIPHADVEERMASMLALASSKCETLYIARDVLFPAHEQYSNVVWGGFHASGHGKRDDLREIVERVNPRVVVPVHAGRERREAVQAIVSPYASLQLVEEGEEFIVV